MIRRSGSYERRSFKEKIENKKSTRREDPILQYNFWALCARRTQKYTLCCSVNSVRVNGTAFVAD